MGQLRAQGPNCTHCVAGRESMYQMSDEISNWTHVVLFSFRVALESKFMWKKITLFILLTLHITLDMIGTQGM